MDNKRLVALVTQAQKGDRGAFEELYSAHAQSILFHVKSLLYEKDDYTDVAQDVALRLYEQLGSLKEPAAFRGWMHQIIRSICTDHNRSYLRQAGRQSPVDAEEYLDKVVDEAPDTDPAAVWDTKLEGNRIYSAVSELSSNYREVLMLRYYDDLSYKEIAEALGVSLDNVKVRLHRATEAARKIMSEQENKEREDAFAPGDSQAKQALAGAVAVLVPPEVVNQYVEQVNLKLAATAPVAAAHQVATATAPVLSKLAIIATSIALIAACVGGCAGITWFMSQEEAAPPTEELVTQEVLDYEGTANIVFVDAQGEDTQNGVTSVAVVEEEAVIALVTYEVVDANDAVVLIGAAAEIPSTDLASLEPGLYKVSFTLTDDKGAQAMVSRSFMIAG